MDRSFCVSPWLMAWPWLIGVGLASFVGGANIVWMLVLLVVVCRVPIRTLIVSCLIGFLWGSFLLPVGWRTLSWDAYVCRAPKLVPLMQTDSVGWAVDVRRWGTERLRMALPPRDATLAAGMLYGDATFTAKDKIKIRAAGISHIVAVSGANILFLLVLIRWIAYRLVRVRRFRQIADMIGILLIVVLTGASSSVLRAGLMLVLYGSAWSFGRKASFSRMLLLTAVVLVMVEPRRLLFDAGFLLSCFACIGLLHAAQPRSLEPDASEQEGIVEKLELRATWYASVWTMPFQLWFFGGVSWLGLITNALVLFIVPWIQVLTVVTIILPVFSATTWMLRMCLDHIWMMVDWMSLYTANISVSAKEAFWMMLGSYVILTMMLIHKRMHHWTWVSSSVVDITRSKQLMTLILSACIVPLFVDVAPDLVVFAIFSMLKPSTKGRTRFR